MPPKKVVEDKTFGLKNKNKSKKVQKYVQQIQQNQSNNNQPQRETQVKKKDLELFQPMKIVQKIPFGQDPKTIYCINFKNKCCDLGQKCKFSHVPVAQKPLMTTTSEEPIKAPLYETAIGNTEVAENQTDIICKHFLEAVESEKYGWFWECPSIAANKKCIYKHALPAGYELKKGKPREEQQVITIEELIESKRRELTGGKMVTLETFNEWKKQRNEKKEKLEGQVKKEKLDLVKRKIFSGLSGREMFQFNPELAVDAGDEDLVMDTMEMTIN